MLEKINGPSDIKRLTDVELTELAGEIRRCIIEKLSVKGGHLASNLGVIELTIALHYVFESPKDKIIFDVSHQCYTHKILTGRKEAFLNPDKYDDVSGYTNPAESEHDLFAIGHTSTSISLASGMVKSRDLKGTNENIIALIGDSALDGGQAFEALNYLGEMNSGVIVVVNDNDFSIPENHGALCKHLRKLRESNGHVKNNYFESLGFEYLFIRDGHNIRTLIDTLSSVKNTEHPIVIHCCTRKGNGYSFAEANREKWHWAHPFDVRKGTFLSYVPKENYGAIVSDFLLEKIQEDSDIIIVAASTPLCIGFTPEKRRKAGPQFVDVGIAEQNAISFAAGASRNGLKPVFATNSTFFQRAYDQIEQEVCIGKLPITMIVTHAGVRGHTNDTHAGLYDIALLSNVPNLVYLAPTCKKEYLDMLEWAIGQKDAPVAIRVPWNGVYDRDCILADSYMQEKYEVVKEGGKVAILALGAFYQLGEKIVALLEDDYKIRATLINPRFITGIDIETLETLKENHSLIVTLEDGVKSGGFGAKISQYYSVTNIKVLNYGFPLNLPNRWDPDEMMRQNRLIPELVVEDIMRIIEVNDYEHII